MVRAALMGQHFTECKAGSRNAEPFFWPANFKKQPGQRFPNKPEDGAGIIWRINYIAPYAD